ncbi:MAG: tyrosinase family protein [Pseudomonadota bacterium]
MRLNLRVNTQLRADYVKGVKWLKAETGIKKAPSNGAPINTYDYYVDVHQGATSGRNQNPDSSNAAHRSPAFLPWHSAFITMFEKNLQRVLNDPRFELPYWDWAYDAMLADPRQAVVWSDDFMGGDGDPVTTDPFREGEWRLYNDPNSDSLYRRFGPKFGVTSLPPQSDVEEAMGFTVYDTSPWNASSRGSFRNKLEGWDGGGKPQLHNQTHVWVGGAMLPMSSPNDPVFFLHHCNVDRLWRQWQAKHPDLGYRPNENDTRQGGVDENKWIHHVMWGVDKTPESQWD